MNAALAPRGPRAWAARKQSGRSRGTKSRARGAAAVIPVSLMLGRVWGALRRHPWRVLAATNAAYACVRTDTREEVVDSMEAVRQRVDRGGGLSCSIVAFGKELVRLKPARVLYVYAVYAAPGGTAVKLATRQLDDELPTRNRADFERFQSDVYAAYAHLRDTADGSMDTFASVYTPNMHYYMFYREPLEPWHLFTLIPRDALRALYEAAPQPVSHFIPMGK